MTDFKIKELGEVDSTNKYALENFDSLEDGTLVTAETQTAGKGRLGRKWVSPEGNVYASYIIKGTPFPHYCASWIAGLAALYALRESAPALDVWLKWPNDVYCGEKKICGVLCDAKTDSKNQPLGIVLGIGINLNTDKKTLDLIDKPATSVYAETTCAINKNDFVKTLYKKLTELYISGSHFEIDKIYHIWKGENIPKGRFIEAVLSETKTITGILEDIGPQGELIISSGGNIVKLYSGDVSVKNITNFKR